MNNAIFAGICIEPATPNYFNDHNAGCGLDVDKILRQSGREYEDVEHVMDEDGFSYFSALVSITDDEWERLQEEGWLELEFTTGNGVRVVIDAEMP